MIELNNDELGILEQLSKTGAATVTDLAVRLRDLPEEIEPTLKQFQAKGLVEVTTIGDKYDHEVYRVSDRGRRVMQFLQTL